MSKSILITLLVVLSLSVKVIDSYDSRFKVCTAQELRQMLEQNCMHVGRDKNSALSVNPYGSISGFDGQDANQASDEVLIEVLKDSRHYADSRARSSPRQISLVYKRDQESFDGSASVLNDYINYCCRESCVISMDKLQPYCGSI